MSTRAYICMATKDGRYRGIYNHWDGYLSGVGSTLLKYYQDQNKVESLIDLGDISALGRRLEAPIVIRKYGFNWFMNSEFSALSDKDKEALKVEEQECTIAYARDRGEEKHIATWTNSEEMYNDLDLHGSMIDFIYIFKQSKWYYYFNDEEARLHALTNLAIKRECNG